MRRRGNHGPPEGGTDGDQWAFIGNRIGLFDRIGIAA